MDQVQATFFKQWEDVRLVTKSSGVCVCGGVVQPQAAPQGGGDKLGSLMGFFADQAVQYARRINNPAFISCVLASILRKTADHRLEPGGLEEGFLTRIAKLAYAGSLN